MSKDEGSSEKSPTIPSSDLISESSLLTVRHMLVWVTCVALLSSIAQITGIFKDYDGIFLELLGCVTEGTALAGLLLAFSQVVQRKQRIRNGGEWLWVAAGLQTVRWFTLNAIYRIADWDMGWETFSESIEMLELMIWGAIYLYAIQSCREFRWKLVFLVLPVSTAVAHHMKMYPPVIATISSLVNETGADLFVTTIILLFASIDLTRKHRLPWSHWVGIMTYILQSTCLSLYWPFRVFFYSS